MHAMRLSSLSEDVSFSHKPTNNADFRQPVVLSRVSIEGSDILIYLKMYIATFITQVL